MLKSLRFQIVPDFYTQNIEIYIYPKRFNLIMKRGQTKGTIAPLILLITLLLVLYVIMLPEDMRNDLLDESSDGIDIDNLTGQPSDIGISDSIRKEEILLRKNPGRLDRLDFKQVKNTLPAINLFSETSDEEFAYLRSIYVENSLFSEEADQISFKLDKPSDNNNLLLSFNAKQRAGRLVITLNGQVVFNDELAQPTVEPIKLPVGILQNDNIIEFINPEDNETAITANKSFDLLCPSFITSNVLLATPNESLYFICMETIYLPGSKFDGSFNDFENEI